MDSAGLVQDCDAVASHCFPSWPWLAVWLFENLSAHLTVCLKQFRSPYTFIQVRLIDSSAAVHTQSGNVGFQLSPCVLPLSGKMWSMTTWKFTGEKKKKYVKHWQRQHIYSIKRCFWPCRHDVKISCPASLTGETSTLQEQSWIWKLTQTGQKEEKFMQKLINDFSM